MILHTHMRTYAHVCDYIFIVVGETDFSWTDQTTRLCDSKSKPAGPTMMDELDFDNSATQKKWKWRSGKLRNPVQRNPEIQSLRTMTKCLLSRSRRRPAKNQQRIERNKQRKRQKVRSRIRRLPKGSLQNWLNCPPNIVTSCPQTPWRDNRSEPWMFCLRVFSDAC